MDKNNLILQVLEEIGLTKSEIAVYLALLELGSSSSGKIVDKSKTTSSKIYEVLERLMQKGLASFIIKGGVKHFEAASPERIGDYVEEKRKRIELQSKSLNDILPELKLKQQVAKTKSEATIYKGIKGLQAAYSEILANSPGIAEFTAWNVPKRTGSVHNFFKKLHRDCDAKGIKRRIIMSADAGSDLKTSGNYSNSEVKFHSQTTSSSINVVGDYTVIFPTESTEITLFVIHDTKTAENFRVEFERLWNQTVTVSKGFDSFRQIMHGIVDRKKPGEHMDVLWAGVQQNQSKKEYEELFDTFTKYRKEKKVVPRLLFEKKSRPTILKYPQNYDEPHTKIKYLPYEMESPVEVFIDKDRAHINIQGDEPTVITIENEQIANAFQKQFNELWNQDVIISKGEDDVIIEFDNLLDELEPGEEYTVQGAAFGRGKSQKMYERIFTHLHMNRQKQNKKVKLLFEQGCESIVESNTDVMYRGAKTDFLPYRSEIPVQVMATSKKARIMVQGEEPVLVTIDNEDIANAFTKNFDMLWDQEVKTHRGLDAVTRMFNEMIEAGHCDFIGARGYFMDKKPAWIKEWAKRAEKSGFTMRNVVDDDVKGHYITTLPFAETKYTLQKEFVDLSVYWIYGDKVIMTNWDGDEPVLIEMKIPRIVAVYKKQFELLWGNT